MQRAKTSIGSLQPRKLRLVTEESAMHTLVFDRRDISLEYENQCLIVRQPDALPRSIPLTHIRRVLCLHSVRLTTSLLGQFWQRGIDFVAINSRYSERS